VMRPVRVIMSCPGNERRAPSHRRGDGHDPEEQPADQGGVLAPELGCEIEIPVGPHAVGVEDQERAGHQGVLVDPDGAGLATRRAVHRRQSGALLVEESRRDIPQAREPQLATVTVQLGDRHRGPPGRPQRLVHRFEQLLERAPPSGLEGLDRGPRSSGGQWPVTEAVGHQKPQPSADPLGRPPVAGDRLARNGDARRSQGEPDARSVSGLAPRPDLGDQQASPPRRGPDIEGL
jgi:hypothetical protein